MNNNVSYSKFDKMDYLDSFMMAAKVRYFGKVHHRISNEKEISIAIPLLHFRIIHILIGFQKAFYD